jgi:hypothetical protein
MDGKTTAAWQRTSNYVSGGGETMALTTTTTKQQSINMWQQRRRTTMAGKRRGPVVEAEEGRVMHIFLHGEFWGESYVNRTSWKHAQNRGRFS